MTFGATASPLPPRPSSLPDGPQPGDVVVSQHGGSSGGFLVRQLPDEIGVIVPLRSAAVALAARFARSVGVAVWQVERGSVTRLHGPR